ncbi:MAG: hypothetical protein ACFB5Z_00820 [Elainellaceae cyanobacterium]
MDTAFPMLMELPNGTKVRTTLFLELCKKEIFYMSDRIQRSS